MAKKKKRSKKKSKALKKKASKKIAKKSRVSLNALEREIARLTDLVEVIKRKSSLVRRSLNYLEREQKRVIKQINQARRFLTKLKNRGLRAWQNFPENAESVYRQLKTEFNRLSKKLMPS